MHQSVAAPSKNHPSRISHLDGLRGLAILLVFFFHAYARWPGVVPYGNEFAAFPIFKYGWLGVELFFLISGYVILMTLERCRSRREFLYRRWIRLFPAMLICSALVYLSAPVFHERPAGVPTAWSLLPALTFSEPSWWSALLGFRVNHLEGAFWSLCVEVKFYIFAAVFFYWKGRSGVLAAISLAFVLFLMAPYIVMPYLGKLPGVATFQYFGWFGAGALFYVYSSSGSRVWMLCALAMGSLAAFALGVGNFGVALAGLAVLAVFAFACVSPIAQRALRVRMLLFFGFISYPLYLIHENALIAGVVKIGRFTEITRGYVMVVFPVAMLAGLACVAYVIARQAEPRIRMLIQASSAALPSKTLLPVTSGASES